MASELLTLSNNLFICIMYINFQVEWHNSEVCKQRKTEIETAE